VIEFILNNEKISTNKPTGYLLLDLIRYDKSLTGTKIGCREGDCGACTILIGELEDGKMNYLSATSCLTPIGNVHGKHVVTVEGLNIEGLSPVQQAMIDESGTQCGFCTVGFVTSLAGFCLENSSPTYQNALAAIDGNICRCTGYKSIERAARKIIDGLEDKNLNEPLSWLINRKYIPAYFSSIPNRLLEIESTVHKVHSKKVIVGGGTDLYVQQPETFVDQNVGSIGNDPDLRFISVEKGICSLGGGSTVSDIVKSDEMQLIFPQLNSYIKLVSSTPIRNISTIAGNFVNASPIGDFTIFFLALNSKITLIEFGNARSIYLKDFYQGYKDIDKTEEEVILNISFEVPKANSHFNFEKISKREHLDIASVNSALQITVEDDTIADVNLSAGGVGPIPKYLAKTCAFLQDKKLSTETIKSASEIIQSEISPISDARGSADYKRLLLRQLFYAHFIKLFPEQITMESLR
jgi:xanthine dehydrogenase small subunit